MDARIDDLAVWTDTFSTDFGVLYFYYNYIFNGGLDFNNTYMSELNPGTLYSWHPMGDGLELNSFTDTFYNMAMSSGHGRSGGPADRDIVTPITGAFGVSLGPANWATAR